MYFAHRFHVETGNPSIHSLLQTSHLFFCSKIRANPNCKFSEACLCRKGQGTSFGWLLSHVLHDVVAIELSKIAQNLNMYMFPHTFIYPALISAFEFLLCRKRGKRALHFWKWNVRGAGTHSPWNLSIPQTQAHGSLAQIPSLQTTRIPCDVHLNRPSKHHYYGVAMALMSTL